MYLYFVVVAVAVAVVVAVAVAVGVVVVVVVGRWLLVVGCCLLFVVCCCPKKIASPQTGTPLDPWIKQNPKILCDDNLQHSWCNSPVLHCCPGLVDILVVNCIVGVQDLPVLRAEHKL